ncbi:MAG: hypothetical protein ACREJT_18010 [Myxococcota bacterium]
MSEFYAFDDDNRAHDGSVTVNRSAPPGATGSATSALGRRCSGSTKSAQPVAMALEGVAALDAIRHKD